MTDASQYRYILERETIEAGPQASRGNRMPVRRWKQVCVSHSRDLLVAVIESHPQDTYQIVDRFPAMPQECSS